MRCVVALGAQLLGEVDVEVGERLKEALWMSQSGTGEAGGVVGQFVHSVRENRCAAVQVV